MPPQHASRPAHHTTVEVWTARASGELAAAWRWAVPEAALRKLAGVRDVERNRRIVQLALRQSVFSAYLGRPLRNVDVTATAAGAIVPPSSPIVVSASHHDDVTVLALAEGPRALGVDIEPVYEPGWDDALEEVLGARELEALVLLPTGDRPAAYHTCWTLKEAVMKALGEGLSDRDPKAIEVAVPPAAARLVSLDGVAAPSDWSLATAALGEHVCSLAALGAGTLTTRLRRWPVDLSLCIR